MASGQQDSEYEINPHCRKCAQPKLTLFQMESGHMLCKACAPRNASEELASIRTGYRPPVVYPPRTSIRSGSLTWKQRKDRDEALRRSAVPAMLSPRIQ